MFRGLRRLVQRICICRGLRKQGVFLALELGAPRLIRLVNWRGGVMKVCQGTAQAYLQALKKKGTRDFWQTEVKEL